MKDKIISFLGIRLRSAFEKLNQDDFKLIYEIRIRINKPLIINKEDKEFFLTSKGEYTQDLNKAIIATKDDLLNTLEMMSQHSMYAFEEEMRQGYITLEGGHRVGIVGKMIQENKSIKSIKYIGALNIRIAHEILGAADKIIPFIYDESGDIYHTLIVSPPRCGKTTILRDLVRQVSNGSYGYPGMGIGVVDERSEIGGCYKGIPQNDIGIRTDVLDGCNKVDGMLMLLRSMSPAIIAIDEIGSKEDLFAIEEILNAGIKIICTVHANNLKDIMNKPILKGMIENHFFGRIICLSSRKGPGTIESILDGITLKDCRVIS